MPDTYSPLSEYRLMGYPIMVVDLYLYRVLYMGCILMCWIWGTHEGCSMSVYGRMNMVDLSVRGAIYEGHLWETFG